MRMLGFPKYEDEYEDILLSLQHVETFDKPDSRFSSTSSKVAERGVVGEHVPLRFFYIEPWDFNK